jgi:hypothetical protein
MENKRGSSGFIGTSVGVAMTIIQSTHPEWFGNHPWILPVSLLLIFAGLLFWLTQIAWIQRLLGLSRAEVVHTNLASAKPKIRSRLKIISAHYGVEGISDPDVTHFLEERVYGNALAEPIGADLFHGLDPVDGKNKRLKVHYSFDGREAMITRPQYAMLILPEDSFLTQQLDQIKQTHQDEMRRLEVSNNAYLSNAQEARRQCEEERREVLRQLDETKGQLTILSPIQLEALALAKDLRDFLASLEPFPDDPKQEPGESTVDHLTKFISVRAEKQAKWGQKLMHGYANRGFGARITALMHRAGEEVDYPAHVPNYAETITPTKDGIPKLAQQMEMVAIWINRKQRNEVNLLGETRVS